MKKIILVVLSVLSFLGCAAQNQSWVIYDNETHDCVKLFNRQLTITDKVRYLDIQGSVHRTSNDFDIAVVHGERYDLAADQIGVHVEECHDLP